MPLYALPCFICFLCIVIYIERHKPLISPDVKCTKKRNLRISILLAVTVAMALLLICIIASYGRHNLAMSIQENIQQTESAYQESE